MRKVTIEITDNANKMSSVDMQMLIDKCIFLIENEGLSINVSYNYATSGVSELFTPKQQTRPKECVSQFDKFKKRYLTTKQIHPIVSPDVSFNRLYNYKVDWDEVREYIRVHLKYNDFLETLYWAAIRAFVKEKSGYACKLCGNSEGLHVHHVSYKNHGDELHHLDDLICLCSVCHAKIHNKELNDKDTGTNEGL